MNSNDVIQICMIAFGAGVTIGIIKTDLIQIKKVIKELKDKEMEGRAYLERQLTKITEKFEKRFKMIEDKLKLHGKILNIKDDEENNKKS